MSILAQLSQQLSILNDTLRQTRILIDRLANLSFQPGSEPLDESTGGSARVELAQDIQDSLKQLDEDFELLRSDFEDLSSELGPISRRKDTERERVRERLDLDASRFGDSLRQARTAFRSAQLSAKRASEAAKTQERVLIFKSIVTVPEAGDTAAGKSHRRQKTQQLSKDEIVANASSDVTAALRRTHELLSTELSRSRFAQETFDNSTDALKELGEKYSSLDTILTNSRGLLSTLLRSQKSDTWYLETALYILLATLVWLIFRRLLFGPFVKLPLFLWRVFAFLANWTILRPLYLLLTLSGVIRSEPVTSRLTASAPTKSRAPLIVQPSAKDFPSSFPEGEMPQIREGGMPVGAGGAGAKVGKDELAGAESQKIAQMADKAQHEPVRRGDGTVLEDRGDIPKNPRKKVLEEEPAVVPKRDEL